MHTAVLSSSALALTLSSVGLAQISVVTDNRSLNTTSLSPGGAGVPGTASPSGSIFNTTATSLSTNSPSGQTLSTARQNTTILADRIFGTGSGQVDISLGSGSMGAYSGSARSNLDITFNLASNSSFTLLATSTYAGFPISSSDIRFKLSGGSLASPIQLLNTGGTINTSGFLNAGTYRIEAYSYNQLGGSGAGGGGSFDFNFVVPSPGAAIPLLGFVAISRRRRR